MTEPRHFHSARKGSGSLRPFPIYPLYTQAEILSLDKPIADCFLFRPRKRLEKCRKRSHTNVSNTLVTRPSTPPAQTPHVRFHERKWVHTRLSEKERTQRHTRRKRGRFGWGAIITLDTSYTFTNIPGPGVRTAYFGDFGSRSRVLPKNAKSLRDSDALMRVAGPRRRGPAGLPDPVAVPLTALIGFTILLSRIVAHRKLSACSLVTAVRFWNRCSRRSMRGTCLSERRSDCRF